jgi:hypothetical protein
MEKKWEEMTADEKQEAMFQRWASPKDAEGNPLQFESPEAEKLYKERTTRIKDAVQMKKMPDRIPVFAVPSFYPAHYSRYTPQEIMYDYKKCYDAWIKFYVDFQPDAHTGAVLGGPGKVFDLLDYKLYAYPGHGVAPEHSYQCLEKEVMQADEYDVLIADPGQFFAARFIPRAYGALEDLTMNPIPEIGVLEMYGNAMSFLPYGLPPVQEAYKKLFEAGAEVLNYIGVIGGFDGEMAAKGMPSNAGGMAKAPFDCIGDTLRSSRGVFMDMYRQPDKLIKAMEVLVPINIQNAIAMCEQAGNPLVMMPLHKGADGFLSDEQFKTFYWPSLKAVLLGLIENGLVPFPFVEGSFNSRLKYLQEIPRGTMIWLFDATDMAQAKEIVGGTSCIAGNMPMSLLALGTVQEVKDYAKKLIDTAGKGGGFIMSNGAFFDDVKPENLHAMIDFTKEYGVYT